MLIYVLDLDSTIISREKPRLGFLDSLGLRVRGEYYSLSQNYSFGCFEGRELILKSRVGNYRVFFRRGLFKLISLLGRQGKIVIASHACPWFVEAVANFLRRNILVSFPVEARAFPKNQLKSIDGNVQLIIDDKPQRWVESARPLITTVPGFTGRTCAYDSAIHFIMLSRPDLFPTYNPANLRVLVNAPMTSVPGCDAVRSALCDLISRKLHPVIPLARCRRWNCKTFKNNDPNAVCEICSTRDSEGSA